MDNGHMGGVVVPPCFSPNFYPTQTKPKYGRCRPKPRPSCCQLDRHTRRREARGNNGLFPAHQAFGIV